jgi:hypothetical protein
MSACAGSSTDGFAVPPLALPEDSGRKCKFYQVFRRPGPMDRAPGRIGFMSTQRRENRWRYIDCSDVAEVLGFAIPDPKAERVRTNANGGTAPPGISASFHPSDEDLSPGVLEQLATNSLQLGYGIVQLAQFAQLCCFVQIVQLVLFVRSGLRFRVPPFGAGVGAASGSPANHGSSLRHIPFPPGLSRFHPALPRVPAGLCRWAERYDVKGNLYLQHAA